MEDSINMKKTNNAFAIAMEYANKIDLTGITKDNVYEWAEENNKQWEPLTKDYLADTRLNWKITNESYYLETFEKALEHIIEKKFTNVSSWELAKKLIAENPQYPHNAYNPKVSQYPDELMKQYRELLDKQTVQFKWNDKNNSDALWKGTFMGAWHDGEKIPVPTIFGIPIPIVSGIAAAVFIYSIYYVLIKR